MKEVYKTHTSGGLVRLMRGPTADYIEVQDLEGNRASFPIEHTEIVARAMSRMATEKIAP
jgi:hypothetical protein